jgi:hypothetical protein
MSETKQGQFKFTTPVTLNHGHLFQARAFKGKNGQPTGKERFEADLEIDPSSPDADAMKRLALAVAKAKWPDRDFRGEVAARTFQMPWQSGDVLADKAKAKSRDGADVRVVSRGKLVVKARTEYAPRLAVLEGGSVVDYLDERRPLAKEFFYNGVKVFAQVTFNAYEGVGSNPDGVNAYLDMVVSTRRGERLKGQGQSPSEAFSAYAGRFTEEDPTGGVSSENDVTTW